MNTEAHNDDTAEFLALPAWTDTGSARVEVDLAGMSHAGRVRQNNEDHYLAIRFSRSCETVLTNLPPEHNPARVDEIGYVMIVADGIGGTPGGEVASRMVISAAVSLALATPDWVFSAAESEVQERLRRMANRFQNIQQTLRTQARHEPGLRQMGTTLSVAFSFGANLILGYVGNSRIYLFRDGHLHQLSHDHTVVQSMVDSGQLTPEQAAKHPRRHVLARSFYAGTDVLEPDFQLTTLVTGDQLLVCTDGLTEMVRDDDIGSILKHASSADESCRNLVHAALSNGGKDNVTVVLARYRIPGSE